MGHGVTKDITNYIILGNWPLTDETKLIPHDDLLSIGPVGTNFTEIMMTSWNGNIFRLTGHLCGEFSGLRWIPRTKACDVELWYFLWFAPKWKVE